MTNATPLPLPPSPPPPPLPLPPLSLSLSFYPQRSVLWTKFMPYHSQTKFYTVLFHNIQIWMKLLFYMLHSNPVSLWFQKLLRLPVCASTLSRYFPVHHTLFYTFVFKENSLFSVACHYAWEHSAKALIFSPHLTQFCVWWVLKKLDFGEVFALQCKELTANIECGFHLKRRHCLQQIKDCLTHLWISSVSSNRVEITLAVQNVDVSKQCFRWPSVFIENNT